MPRGHAEDASFVWGGVKYIRGPGSGCMHVWLLVFISALGILAGTFTERKAGFFFLFLLGAEGGLEGE